MAIAVAEFFLQQTPAERQAEEEVLQAGYLLVAESTLAAPKPLRRPAVVEAEGPRLALRAAAKLQPPSSGSLKQYRAPSRNTSAVEAGKLAVSVAPAFVSRFLAYSDQPCGPGTPFNASLLISKEIL